MRKKRGKRWRKRRKEAKKMKEKSTNWISRPKNVIYMCVYVYIATIQSTGIAKYTKHSQNIFKKYVNYSNR